MADETSLQIRVPNDLLERLEELGAGRRQSVEEVIIEAIRDKIADDGEVKPGDLKGLRRQIYRF